MGIMNLALCRSSSKKFSRKNNPYTILGGGFINFVKKKISTGEHAFSVFGHLT